RDRVEGPDAAAASRIECADVARRIVPVYETIADAVAENHEILVDHRRRSVGVVLPVDLPHEAAADIERSLLAERRHRLARGSAFSAGADSQAGVRRATVSRLTSASGENFVPPWSPP